ncbi:hypothetical protein OPV22_017098 [Ensete ventricosum]|uniref:Uncharacterized protein n=1 Tax=Ensete ventricosum TaxID=4639 RepID=A0AAV8QVJ5_ENSVE|nr:hypothetical protein OPV22_017098 [Ensete ventricosum]
MLILRHDQTTKHKKGLPLVAICSYDVDSHLKRPGSYQSWRVGEEASPCSKTNRVRAIRALTEAKDFSETSLLWKLRVVFHQNASIRSPRQWNNLRRFRYIYIVGI